MKNIPAMDSSGFLKEIDYSEIKLQRVVGKGSFGTVQKGTWGNRDVAVKLIETEQEKNAFLNEVHQLSRVNHPNIVKLYGACTKTQVCLIMEYAEGGSLYNVLHCMKQVQYTATHAISWLLQCASGVAYLHDMKPKPLIHRDLKPPNLLLVRGGTILKICDFGTACDKHTIMSNTKGSAAWMAPEVFEGSQYNEKCDVFSWAIILWEVLARKKPFHDGEGMTAFGIMWAVHTGKRPPLIQDCPKPIENIMTKCWSQNPSDRPSMSEAHKELSKVFKFMEGADKPIKFLSQTSEDDDSEKTPIIMSLDNNKSKNSEPKTVLPSNENIEVPNMPVLININESDNKLLSPDAAAEKFPYLKKRRSADFSSSDVKLPSNLGHRRSGSYDSANLKLESILLDDTKHENSQSAAQKVIETPEENFRPFSYTSNYFLLEPNLQPLPPVQCQESIRIYEKHVNLAYDLFRCRNEISLLKERKSELQNQLQDRDNSYTYIDEYLQLKKEQDSLLQLRQNLKRQLEIIRSRQHQNKKHEKNSDDWVMV